MRRYEVPYIQGVPYPHELPFTEVDQQKLDELHGASVFVPKGGVTGDVLRKRSNLDYEFQWVNPQVYDGTLDAGNQPQGAVPTANGDGTWNWLKVDTTVYWANIQDKPAFKSAALAEADTFAPKAHKHAAADIDSGVLAAARVPRATALNGISYGTAAPSGGVDGDLYFQYTV